MVQGHKRNTPDLRISAITAAVTYGFWES